MPTAIRQALPTPRMQGERVSDEQRRESTARIVHLDATRSVLFRLTHIYAHGHDPNGVYRGTIMQAVATIGDQRHDPIQISRWLHPNDRKRFDEAIQTTDDMKIRKSLSDSTLINRGINNLLRGFISHRQNGARSWTVGMLDRIGHLLGGYIGPMPESYMSPGSYEMAKRSLRTTATDLTAHYKNFRARVYRDLVPSMAADIRQSLHRRMQDQLLTRIARNLNGRYKQRKRTMAQRTMAKPAAKPGRKPKASSLVSLMVQAIREHGPQKRADMLAFAEANNYQTTFKDISAEMDQIFKDRSKSKALFAVVNSHTRPYTYKLSAAGEAFEAPASNARTTGRRRHRRS